MSMAEQGTLLEYRSRGIYVLAVYLEGNLWSYFYYPSEEKRDEAADHFWPRLFSELGMHCYFEFLEP
jgi:hypothetical protein